MKNIFILVFVTICLNFAAFAKQDGGGSSGGQGSSGGSSGGSGGSSGDSGGRGESDGSGYRGSTGLDAELKKIIFEIEKNNNYEGALKDLEVYVYENPQNANGWSLIGFASRKLGKYEDSELYYSTGLEIDPNHDDILAYQGELFLETGRYEKALLNLEKLTEICVFNCDEKKELSEAISNYESENNL